MIVRASSLATPTTEETPSFLHSRPYHIQIRSNRRQNIESTTVRLNSRLTNLEAQYILIIYSTARARMPIWVHAEPKLFEGIVKSLQIWNNYRPKQLLTDSIHVLVVYPWKPLERL